MLELKNIGLRLAGIFASFEKVKQTKFIITPAFGNVGLCYDPKGIDVEFSIKNIGDSVLSSSLEVTTKSVFFSKILDESLVSFELIYKNETDYVCKSPYVITLQPHESQRVKFRAVFDKSYHYDFDDNHCFDIQVSSGIGAHKTQIRRNLSQTSS
ncbi:hypothetical protein FWP56_22220 [Vibrio vulnificus]|nr:hypothetical protein [Vibrio vulnificus]